MANPSKQLLELQEIDIELAKARDTLSHLEKQLDHNPELAKAVADLQRKQAELADLRKQQKDIEYALDDMTAKLKPLKKKLYDGSVKNPKELAGLKEQVDQISQKVHGEEDKVLDLMMRGEAMQEELSAQDCRVKELEEEWEKRRQALLAEKAELESTLEMVCGKRENLVASLDPDHVRIYEHVRTRNKGLAVARVEQGRCLGCRIALSTAEISRARGSDLVQCDSCGRVLCLG